MENKILVYYIGIGDLDSVDVPEYIDKVAKKITPSTFQGEIIIMPVLGSDSRIECINPKYINDKELIEVHEELMKELNIKLKQQIENDKI